jgi:hypothetical protein
MLLARLERAARYELAGASMDPSHRTVPTVDDSSLHGVCSSERGPYYCGSSWGSMTV